MEDNKLYNINDKILLGNSIPLPEQDLDEDLINSDAYDGNIALQEYWFVTVINSINTSSFKNNYHTVINDIKLDVDIKDQIDFCSYILMKIVDEYDFEFPEKPVVKTKEDVQDVYKFLEFIEYDNENFLVSVWRNIKVDLASKRLSQVCLENMDAIIFEIDDQSSLQTYSELVSIFLRTYLKDDLFRWFCNQTKSQETTITARIMKEI
jgi:hypothetical protein